MSKLTSESFSAMQTGNPIKVYTKATLGKVAVRLLDPFENVEDKILFGRKNSESATIKLWTENEVAFFRRMNKRHLDMGTLIEWVEFKEEKSVPTIEQASDEELVKVLNSKFFTLATTLGKTESIPFLHRVLSTARDLEKSEKIINAIEMRIAEVELG